MNYDIKYPIWSSNFFEVSELKKFSWVDGI